MRVLKILCIVGFLDLFDKAGTKYKHIIGQSKSKYHTFCLEGELGGCSGMIWVWSGSTGPTGTAGPKGSAGPTGSTSPDPVKVASRTASFSLE